jgi:ABC-2 type transport system ATP-binding protein
MGRTEPAAGGNAKVIRTDSLSKKFGRHEALRDLNLSVPEGSAYALIGSNGAGKTTTIRILMNILGADGGTATILGVDSRRISPRELARIGYVSENQVLPKRLTVAEFLAYLRPFYPTWDQTLEASILRQMRLSPGLRIDELSHGMRMKMALVCALPFRPKLLILDEPLSGLDPLVRDEFMEGLLRQAGEMTVLMSSHELNEIEGVATHVGFLYDGRLLFEESMAELTERFREVHVTLDGPAFQPGRAPKEWLNLRTMGNVVMFVDSRFSEDRLGAEIGTLKGSIRNIDAQPMSLRSIFTALATATRDAADSSEG